MSFCTTAEVDLGLLQHLRERNTVMAPYLYIQYFIIVALFDSLYCFSVWYYAIPKTLLFLIWIYFLYNISSKWIGTSTRTIFETSDVALISALETMLLKNAFMYEKFLNSNTVSSTSIFLINFFSTQMVAYFSTRRKIFCISSLMANTPPRFSGDTNFWFRNVSIFDSKHVEVKSYFFNF